MTPRERNGPKWEKIIFLEKKKREKKREKEFPRRQIETEETVGRGLGERKE